MFILIFAGAGLAGCGVGLQAPGPAAPPLVPRASESAGGVADASDAAILALSLVGTRYATGGDSPESGFDCSGLVAYVYDRASQRRLPRNTFDLARVGIPVAPGQLQAGDLVFYNTQRRPFSHVGIYLGESRFVHAPSTGGAVRIEEMDVRYWTQRFDGARRLNF
jgi:cell wall-associated NlpC family hydrolase